MDEKTMNKIRELLGGEALERVAGGAGIPEPDVEEVKKIVLQILETFGSREVAIDYAMALGYSREEAESWLSAEAFTDPG